MHRVVINQTQIFNGLDPIWPSETGFALHDLTPSGVAAAIAGPMTT
jgi:hypothetical protein